MIENEPSKTFLLLPPIPTPNGRLHLGHIAGPFLRLDAAARYLRSHGHKAYLVSGTDPYESYVIHHAEKETTEPDKLARRYTLQIQNDLAAFCIDYDIWLDPLICPGRGIYERNCEQLLQRLMSTEAAHYKTRSFPYFPIDEQFIPRSYLAGKCPRCSADVVGCLCEECGLQFTAQEVIAPYFRPAHFRPAKQSAEQALAWQDADVVEVTLNEGDERLKNVAADMQALHIPPHQIETIMEHVYQQKCRVELTVPGTWGVPWQGLNQGLGEDSTITPQIVYTYGAIYLYYLTAGEVFATNAKEQGRSAFAVDSDVVTISSYGADTAVPWIAMPNILSHVDVDEHGKRQYKDCDYYWGNEFLCLHGSKFSTSRRHVIWASGLIDQTPVNADMARFYLATIDPTDEQTDFVIDGLVDTINRRVIDDIYHAVNVCLKAYQSQDLQVPSANMSDLMAKVFAEQDGCFEASQFYLTKAAGVISNWVKTWQALVGKSPQDNKQSDSYWFLKTLAIISYPVMPNFAESLWQNLGATGIPNMAEFDNKTTIKTTKFECRTTHISQADIYPCMPETLSHLIKTATSDSDGEAIAKETNHV